MVVGGTGKWLMSALAGPKRKEGEDGFLLDSDLWERVARGLIVKLPRGILCCHDCAATRGWLCSLVFVICCPRGRVCESNKRIDRV